MRALNFRDREAITPGAQNEFFIKPERHFVRVCAIQRGEAGGFVCETMQRKPRRYFIDEKVAARISGLAVGDILEGDIHRGRVVFATPLQKTNQVRRGPRPFNAMRAA